MRFLKPINSYAGESYDDDLIAGVAQLFDVRIAFIVAVIAALFTLLSSKDFLSKDSEWTLTRKKKDGQIEMIEKKKDKVITRKVSSSKATGNGLRLGTAYQLEDGQIIYVPDNQKK